MAESPTVLGVAEPRAHHQVVATVLAWLAIAAIFFNAAYYTATAANPLVSSDAWHFVDTFVDKALYGTVSIGDLFAKRDGFDHAQPLNKLFLIVNARYLGLDFVYEAFVGVAFALLGFLLVKRAVDEDWRGQPRAPSYYIPLVAVAAVYVSLNSSEVFSWPLVTFGYVTSFFILATIFMAWRAFSTGSVKWYLPAVVLCAVAADDASLLLAIAISLTLLWYGHRSGRWSPALKLTGITLAVAAGYFLLYSWLDTTPRGAVLGFSETAARLLGMAAGPDVWRLLIPYASGVAQFGPLSHHFPQRWETVQIVLGIVVVAAHAWFWYRAWRNRTSAAGFVAIALMLLFYAYVAGILYGRVAQYGLPYFNEQRYVAIYQLGIVALLLMVLATAAQAPAEPRKSSRWLVVAAALLIVVQVPLSRFSWWEAQYSRQYWSAMAAQIGWMSRDPEATPASCVENLVICQWPVERRAKSLKLLRQYQLNLFSPEFQKRHGLSPN